MKTWLEVLSDLFVNIAAAWFAVVFIEPQITSIHTWNGAVGLMFRLSLGIMSLSLAKYFRSKSRRKR